MCGCQASHGLDCRFLRDESQSGHGGRKRGEALYCTNRSHQSGDDMKDEVRTDDDDWHAWSNWRTARPDYGVHVDQTLSWSFLVSIEADRHLCPGPRG